MIYNPVNEVNQSNFFSFNFLKKYRKSTAVLLIWKYRYRYRGTNFSTVPSTGTAVLLQSTVPTYGANEQKIFVDKLQFLRRLAQHTLKQFARFSLRDVRNLC